MASRALKIDPEKSENSNLTTDNRENEIAVLAYQLWQERGCPIGSDQEDWFTAERELARLTVEENFVAENSAAEEADSLRLRFPVRSEADFKYRERLIS